MVQKRPFDDDGEPNNVSPKQFRQLESNIQLVLGFEFPCDAAAQSRHASGDGSNDSALPTCIYHGKLDGDCSELQFCPKKDDAAAKAPISVSCSSLATSSTGEENMRLQTPFHILLSPDYCNFDHPPRTHAYPGEAYGSLFDQPPRKLVPVGPDFQADIPEWHDDNRKINCLESIDEASILPSGAIESVETKLLDYENQSGGVVIIPMSDVKPHEVTDDVGVGRTICLCGDAGSFRCVQQHILEAREKLKKMLGPETFANLGFNDMGEVVAEKWTEEEEQLFHEVVFSNPASLGKNFWDHLLLQFPCRTMKEIVSYYFNVFILHKRAEQNRYDPMNIDSDNDEWQGTDDSADDEDEIDEYDDSVESPVDPDRIQNFDKNTHAYDEDTLGAATLNNDSKCSINVASAKGSTGVPSCDDQNGSSTSVDEDISLKNKSENCKWAGQFSVMNGSTGPEFMLEACNAREWDFGYLTHPRNDVDLLPTCSVIEEVFGAGSWAIDGQELS